MLKQTKFVAGVITLLISLFISGMNNAQANNVEVKMWGGFRDKVVAGGTLVAAQPITYSAPVNSKTYVILAHDPFHWHPFYFYHHRLHRPRWHRLPPPPPPRRDIFHRPAVHRPRPNHRPAGMHRPVPRPRPHVKPAPRPERRDELLQKMPHKPQAGHRPGGARHKGGGHRPRR